MKPKKELQTFIEIWRERPRKSQVSGATLGPDMSVVYFSHVLPKSTYSEGRIDKENIVLMTFEEHQLWEHKQSSLIDRPRWEWVFELKERLQKKYRNPDKQLTV